MRNPNPITRMPLTTSAPAELPAGLQGHQRPRIAHSPEVASTAGDEAVDLAASVGLQLDPWQQLVLRCGLGEGGDGRWAAFEVGCLVSRQNGKGAILEALELAALMLFGEELILHSAHQFKTSAEAFRRVLGRFENSDALRRRVRQVRMTHGEESIELKTGQRLRFLARSTSSGRGFSGDRVILDEAQQLSDEAIEALLPTMSARPNPQVWYAATAPDVDLAPCGPLTRLRRRALARESGLAWLEWSIDPHEEFCGADCTVHDDPADARAWAKANPGLGIRITAAHVEREHASMSTRGFARERLGVGNWPTDDDAWGVIGEAAWAALADAGSQVGEPVAFAADVTPDRGWGAIAVAGRRADGALHVEVVDHRPRTSWMAPRLAELVERWRSCAVVVDRAGPAGSLIAPLEAAGLEVVKPSARDMAQACGQLFEGVTDSKVLRHLGQPQLAAALAGARRRPLGDAWAWARSSIGVDISPLVAVTLAAWGHATRAHLPTGEPQPFFASWR